MKNGNHAFIQKMCIVIDKYKFAYFGKHSSLRYGINVSPTIYWPTICAHTREEVEVVEYPNGLWASDPSRVCRGD